jgi:uncharacterized protein YodC (DUF2158 family)
MSEEAKPGDVVQLKSGGPLMTVSSVGERSMGGGQGVWCEWFDGKKPMSEVFTPTSVKVVKRG